MNSPIKSNKILWDRLTELHVDDPWYRLSDLLEGRHSLKQPELELLGDISDLEILHLQCHFGMDTLSLCRLGAKCTGVDLSSKAIEKARELAHSLQLPAEFVCTQLDQLHTVLDRQFDLVFTSYGVIDWLPDLTAWAALIDRYLRPQGKFVMVEFHPFTNCFDLAKGRLAYPYFNDGQVIREMMQNSYTGTDLGNPLEMHCWTHDLSEVIGVILKAGLNLTDFREYDYTPYPCLPELRKRVHDEYVWKHQESVPLLFGLVAHKL